MRPAVPSLVPLLSPHSHSFPHLPPTSPSTPSFSLPPDLLIAPPGPNAAPLGTVEPPGGPPLGPQGRGQQEEEGDEGGDGRPHAASYSGTGVTPPLSSYQAPVASLLSRQLGEVSVSHPARGRRNRMSPPFSLGLQCLFNYKPLGGSLPEFVPAFLRFPNITKHKGKCVNKQTD